ncbi:MAG: ABC transporter ATP-binding protein [Acetobacteraceae bacterium]|nr:ABC transporter ATP-binding protein [Acetobacteraceae bacterium]
MATPGANPGHALDRAATFSLLSRLWREWLVPFRRRLALVALAALAVSALTALYPIVIERAYAMLTAQDPAILYLLPPAVIGLVALKGAAQYVQAVLINDVVLRVIEALQQSMFSHLLRADLAQLSLESPGRLVARFTADATLVRESLTKATNAFADVFTVVALAASMVWLDWVLSLFALALYPVAAVPIVRIGRALRRQSRGMTERMGDVTATVAETFSGIRLVRTFGLEAWAEARGGAAFASLRESLMQLARGRARIDPVLEFLGGVAVAAVIAFAGWRITIGGGSVGQFTGFVAAMLIAARPVRALGSLNAALQEGLAGLARVFALIDRRPLIVDAPGAVALPPGPGAVRFERVRFAYAGADAPALDEVTLAVPAGSTVALVGPSGSGKSTLMAVLARLYDATGGAVLVDGCDVRGLRLASLRGAIALVAQDVMLFDDTVAANIRFGRQDATDADVEAAARAAAAHDFIAALPRGYATRVGDRGETLSGGQRQRIALARALLRNPRILLLDEATSALDSESEAEVKAAVAALRRGRTTLVIAHRLATVREADAICVLEAGRVVETGSHEALLALGGRYAALCRAQYFADEAVTGTAG